MQSSKSVEVAGVLGIILGSVGAHDWYLGNKKGAMAHVGLLILGVILIIVGSIVLPLVNSADTSMSGTLMTLTMIILLGNAAWGVVEGVLILVQGRAGLVRKEEKMRMAAQQKIAGQNGQKAPKMKKGQQMNMPAPAQAETMQQPVSQSQPVVQAQSVQTAQGGQMAPMAQPAAPQVMQQTQSPQPQQTQPLQRPQAMPQMQQSQSQMPQAPQQG